MLINWLLSALSIIIVANVVPGFLVSGVAAALIAALVIGFVNGTLGFFLKMVTFPLTVVTLGIFWLIINALMLELAAAIVPGFTLTGFLPAFIGSIVLTLVNIALRALIPSK